ncbi:PEP-CTERM sorting domain-containing protein [Crocosphaera sp. UHCC 0190]|jgi:hypothetical protein|uniref:PEP-CTERM sorting domain-containing protein n=1 Tax=Crocosphaera sp. UHCC 0190 TaxID=3110246 RepID=UPI002B21F2E2|nr:PEP-CTERM sorting domain-containing protein [Crocosphaera sp. UHCC 0190]MEA5511040.1 PEP-CTERM sorting domain-containing protein [Crocosphaera sp. UHCC 0190]
MLITNKLIKAFASGLTTIGITAVVGTVNAPSASAAQMTCFEGSVMEGEELGSLFCGDKFFSNFFISDPSDEGTDIVSLKTDGSQWDFFFQFNPDLVAVDTPVGTPFRISYDVDIDPTNNNFFDLMSLDVTTTTPPGVTVVKDIIDSNTLQVLATLTSVGGSQPNAVSILPFHTKNISVEYTITITGDGALDSVGNGLTQQQVPEPSTLLGLGVLGLGGLVSRKRKS